MVFEDTTRIGVPANRLLIADRPDLFRVMANARLLIVAALIAVLLVMLASRRRRGALAVYLAGGLVLVLYAVWAVLGVVSTQPENLERARVIALALVPFAFLAGLLRSRVAGAAAVSDLVGRLGRERGASLRDELAAALGDPSLELAYWTPTGFVDSDGAPFTLREGRVATPVEHTALIVHDASLADERELLDAVAGAAALALENERLAAELRASVKQLRASRARIV